MSNKIRTRDGLPMDFEDGMMVKGIDLTGPAGASAIGYGSGTLKDKFDNFTTEHVDAVQAAVAAKLQAELARDASLVGIVYPTEAAGRAAVNNGEYFKVIGSGEVACNEYQRINANVSTWVIAYPSIASNQAVEDAANNTLTQAQLQVTLAHAELTAVQAAAVTVIANAAAVAGQNAVAVAKAIEAATSATQSLAARDIAVTSVSKLLTPIETLGGMSTVFHSGNVLESFVYDTEDDSDNGEWRKRTSHTGWYNEELGGDTWLGLAADEATIRSSSNIAVGPVSYQFNSGNFSLWSSTNPGTVTAGQSDPLGGTNAYLFSGSGKNIFQTNMGSPAGTNTFAFYLYTSTVGTLSLGGAGQAMTESVTLTAGWNFYTVTKTALANEGCAIMLNGTLTSVTVFRAGYYAGTVTKEQIIAWGGIPLNNGIRSAYVPPAYTNGTLKAVFQNTTDKKHYRLNPISGVTEVFRGIQREFPKVALVVLETARVVIYDGSTPGCPMWMILKSGVGAFWTSYSMIPSTSIRCLSLLNGYLYVGSQGASASGCLYVISFLKDNCIAYQGSTSFMGLWAGGSIANRHTSVANSYYGGTAGRTHNYVIGSSVINNVNAFIAKDTVIDLETGLPNPTVIVGSLTALSIIKPDGIVIWETTTLGSQNAINVNVSKEGRLLRSWNDNNHRFGVYKGDFRLPLTGFSNVSQYDTYWSAAVDTMTVPILPVPAAGFMRSTRSGFALAGAGGINIMRYNENDRMKVMIAPITTTYNGCYHVGDIRGSYLSDIVVETISTAELCLNGSFDTDLTNWTINTGGTSTATWVAGTASLTGDGINLVNISQPFTTVVGDFYKVVFDVLENPVNIAISTTHAGANVFASKTFVAGTKNYITFKATTTTSYVNFNKTGATTSKVDNVSVKHTDPDRSVKQNGLYVVGAVSKVAVETGANLVAYACNSSNYLEQPFNPDFQFGTGDCSFVWWEKLTSVTDQVRRFTRGTASTMSFSAWSGGSFNYSFSTPFTLVNSGVAQELGWNQIAWVRETGVLKLYVQGKLRFSVSNTEDFNLPDAIFRVGTDCAATPSWTGPSRMTQLRISATAPTADMVMQMYRDELQLFQPNAQCTLSGTSDAISATDYDDLTDTLYGVSTYGRQSIRGIRVIETEPTSVGVPTSISAANGVVLMAGGSAKVTQAPVQLRDELRSKVNKGQAPQTFTQLSTGGQTLFEGQVGFAISNVYVNGVMKFAPTDYKITFDGYKEYVIFKEALPADLTVAFLQVRV